MAEVRQRTTGPKPTIPSGSTSQPAPSRTPSHSPSPADRIKAEDEAGLTLLDILRSITLLFLLSSALSWFITGESLIWNASRPAITTPSYWKSFFDQPLHLTDEELKGYDGTDPTKPLLLAINGTIYDVTPGARHYGPGGSYHFFAGADASRGFVTGCFSSDITPDMRNAELAFTPKSTPEIDALFSEEELRERVEREAEEARRKVHEALKHWTDFFAGHPRYRRVGTVKRRVGWERVGEAPELCQQAEESRPMRQPPVRGEKGEVEEGQDA